MHRKRPTVITCAGGTFSNAVFPTANAGLPATYVSGTCSVNYYTVSGSPYVGCDILGAWGTVQNPCIRKGFLAVEQSPSTLLTDCPLLHVLATWSCLAAHRSDYVPGGDGGGEQRDVGSGQRRQRQRGGHMRHRIFRRADSHVQHHVDLPRNMDDRLQQRRLHAYGRATLPGPLARPCPRPTWPPPPHPRPVPALARPGPRPCLEANL